MDHEAQATMIKLSYRDINNIVHGNALKICPVNAKDIEISNDIFGPITKRNDARKSPEQIKTDYIKGPHKMMKINKYVVMVAGMMFVDELTFVMITSRKLMFTMEKYVPNRIEEILLIPMNKCFTYTPNMI